MGYSECLSWKIEKGQASREIRRPLLKRRVTEEEIATVVSRWTGIPAIKSGGSGDKCFVWKNALHNCDGKMKRSQRVNALDVLDKGWRS